MEDKKYKLVPETIKYFYGKPMYRRRTLLPTATTAVQLIQNQYRQVLIRW